MKSWWPVFALALALAGGCGGEDDVVGPFTGEVRRFAVDQILLPLTNDEAKAMAGRLDADDEVDNALGFAIAALASQNNVSRNADDMIRSGAIASSVEIQADSFLHDDTVAVRYLGADGAEAVIVGGRFEDGVFHPNRTVTTRHPGRARVRLPVFLDADPVEITLHGLEIGLLPDAGGAYFAQLHGVVTPADALAAVQQGILQMIAANPSSHRNFVIVIDGDTQSGNNDGLVTLLEIERSRLIQSLLAPDVELRGFEGPMLSIGFQVHLAPCAEGRCIDAPPADRCHDRIVDGDESDVDCGGGCPLRCAGELACRAPADCQSGRCNAGVCAAPSCIDGLTNWLETDVDCGGSCAGCQVGQRCVSNRDCVTQRCGGLGVCLAP